MKKLVLSAAFVAGALTFTTAQVQPVKTEKQTNNEATHLEESLSIERMSNRTSEDMTGRRVIMMEELPESVQEAFTSNKDFKNWSVKEVMEVEATTTDPLQYEIVLVAEDVQDEIEEATEDINDEVQDAAEDGAPVQQVEVKANVPAVVVRYDANGNLISKVDRPAEDDEASEMDNMYRDDQ
jgi:hypothetical protein